MPAYDANNIPTAAARGTLDPELAEFLKTAPRLGAHEPLHAQRVAHDRLIPKTLAPSLA